MLFTNYSNYDSLSYCSSVLLSCFFERQSLSAGGNTVPRLTSLVPRVHWYLCRTITYLLISREEIAGRKVPRRGWAEVRISELPRLISRARQAYHSEQILQKQPVDHRLPLTTGPSSQASNSGRTILAPAGTNQKAKQEVFEAPSSPSLYTSPLPRRSP